MFAVKHLHVYLITFIKQILQILFLTTHINYVIKISINYTLITYEFDM